MNEMRPREEEPAEPARRGARMLALRAILLTAVIVGLAAAIDNRLGLWLALALLIAVLVAVVAFRDNPSSLMSRRSRRFRPRSPLPGADVILAAIPDPVIVVDRRAVVMAASASARALFATLRVDQPLSFAVRAPEVLETTQKVLKKGEPAVTEFGQRGAVERIFELAIVPLAGGGAEGGAVLSFRDVTDARRLERMRVDFVANASHELRTPLASLMGFIETLQGPARNDTAARERFLQIMRDQARRMARLIDDLLSLSRIEMKAHVQPCEAVDLVGVVRHIVDTLRPLAEDRGVAIVCVFPEAAVTVRGDRDELLRVFENLIENAVKYGQSGRRVEVTIEVADEGGEASVSIRDYGPGIAPEHLPRLTERFYRVDVAASREKGGTGLGLAIVKHIVNHHRGRMSVESIVGEGALFCVSLPLFPPSPPEQGGGRVIDKGAGTGSRGDEADNIEAA